MTIRVFLAVLLLYPEVFFAASGTRPDVQEIQAQTIPENCLYEKFLDAYRELLAQVIGQHEKAKLFFLARDADPAYDLCVLWKKMHSNSCNRLVISREGIGEPLVSKYLAQQGWPVEINRDGLHILIDTGWRGSTPTKILQNFTHPEAQTAVRMILSVNASIPMAQLSLAMLNPSLMEMDYMNFTDASYKALLNMEQNLPHLHSSGDSFVEKNSTIIPLIQDTTTKEGLAFLSMTRGYSEDPTKVRLFKESLEYWRTVAKAPHAEHSMPWDEALLKVAAERDRARFIQMLSN